MTRVMIAGVGGASLGTELAKALTLAGGYKVFGCDTSPTAYGLHDPMFEETYVVDRGRYTGSVLDACRRTGAEWLVPGGQEPMVLLAEARSELRAAGIDLAANERGVTTLLSDKAATFEYLKRAGFDVPRTVDARSANALRDLGAPCIVKPATGSGGSAMVFFAADINEALAYADHIVRNGGRPVAQEYLSDSANEFTVGVLHGRDGTLLGSVALRRNLDSKLSVLGRYRGGVVSTGYSQGYIAAFDDVRKQAERLADAVGSRGPVNIQGRVRDGVLVPFEINPRFSASTYLRAMAGFNEVDAFLRYEATGLAPTSVVVREGWYLRSFEQRYVPPEEVSA